MLFLEQSKPRVRQTLKPPIRYAEEESRKTLKTEDSFNLCLSTTHVRNKTRFLLDANEGHSIRFHKKHALKDSIHPVIPYFVETHANCNTAQLFLRQFRRLCGGTVSRRAGEEASAPRTPLHCHHPRSFLVTTRPCHL